MKIGIFISSERRQNIGLIPRGKAARLYERSEFSRNTSGLCPEEPLFRQAIGELIDKIIEFARLPSRKTIGGS